MKKNKLYSLLLCWLLLLAACETPEKVLKSDNLEYKKNKATFWYDKKKYANAIPVLEEVMGLMKGKESTEKFYYMYCWANYKIGDYMIAAYHFKNFTSLFPNSDKAEECMFMYAKSYEKQSPKWELDQSNTYRCLEAFQSFINLYPESSKVDTANQFIDKLRRKLEIKALEAANLYFKTQNYRAAATTYELVLNQYPDIDEVEYINYMMPICYDKYAIQSIPAKQVERFQLSKVYGQKFLKRYPSSKYAEIITKLVDDSYFKIANAAYELAEQSSPLEKEKKCNYAIKEINSQLKNITNQKDYKKANQMVEKCYLAILKNDHFRAEDAKNEEKIALYEKTIKSYYNFADRYKNSKYIHQADRIYKSVQKNISKLKSNG